MAGNINVKLLEDLVTAVIDAATLGTELPTDDPDATGQFVFAVVGIGLGLIPGFGPALGALCNLLGAVLFPTNSTADIWNSLKDRVGQLIDEKIEVYHLGILKDKINGFKNNMDHYQRYINDWSNATPDQKAAAAASVKMVHTAFLSIVEADIPEFQDSTYAVHSLPWFALVANMHLMLLADGIKKGKEWGYSDLNIATLQAQFDSKIGVKRSSVSKNALLPGSHLEDAITKGTSLGIQGATLAGWKQAHATLYGPSVSAPNDASSMDYITYVRQTYAAGRKEVKQEHKNNYYGYEDAANWKALSDYDTCMIVHALNYAELWPFILGSVTPDEHWSTQASMTVDREVFYGPYGRYNDNAPWDVSSPSRVTYRGPHIRAISIQAGDDIDGIQIQHGSKWDAVQGKLAGTPKSFTLDEDEVITSVKVKYGFKLGRLTFTTNKGKQLQNGNARHAEEEEVTVAPAGYMLTSVRITRYVPNIPPGCEGVILGFRPLVTDTNPS